MLRTLWSRVSDRYHNFSLLAGMLRVFRVTPAPVNKAPNGIRRSSGRYRDWLNEFKLTRPKTHWLLITVPSTGSSVLSRIRYAYYEVVDWWESVVVRRCDIAPTGVKRGDFLSVSDMILHASFEQLVLAIEVNYAAQYINYHSRSNKGDSLWDELSKQSRKNWRLHPYKNSKLGRERLYNLMVTGGADEDEIRQRITEYSNLFVLYVWWTQVRPVRGLAADVVGLTAFNAQMKLKYPSYEHPRYYNMGSDDRAQLFALVCAEELLEAARDDEDEAMLAKLVKYRRCI